MKVPELIANILDNLRRHFYTDINTGLCRVREFKRDERQLIKAISTYGYECNARGWNFQADFIYQDLTQLLLQIRTSGVDIHYMPVYLAGAIRRHLGLRAEELNARAKAIPSRLDKVLRGLKAVCVAGAKQEPSDVEIFTEVYRGIHRIQRQRKNDRSSGRKSAQKDLL